MAKGLFGRAFLKRIMLESAGLPPSSNARLFDRPILNHNILWSVKKKNQYIEYLIKFFWRLRGSLPLGGIEPAPYPFFQRGRLVTGLDDLGPRGYYVLDLAESR
jgi:hypothetical protein